jgi:hypothetical protein
MPERLGIAGFLRGTRWVAESAAPSYFVAYEVTHLRTITSGAYLERLNNPTPWSRKMMPHHLNMVRSLCRVRASFGLGLGQALATVRFAPSPGGGRSLSKWLAAEALSRLPERKGLVGAHLLESQPPASVPQTAEQKIRGGSDAQADWVLLICGYDVEAVKTVVAGELAAGELEAHGAAPGAAAGLYRCAYCVTSKDVK